MHCFNLHALATFHLYLGVHALSAVYSHRTRRGAFDVQLEFKGIGTGPEIAQRGRRAVAHMLGCNQTESVFQPVPYIPLAQLFQYPHSISGLYGRNKFPPAQIQLA
jgi:hypothetical protein